MIVGLTGGIGSGKSSVAKLFAQLGWNCFNSDDVAKALYFEPKIKEKVIQLIGDEAYIKENGLNKQFISSRIFSNTELLKQLNAIIHPAVKEKFIQFKNLHPNTILLKESALLFEAGLEKDVDCILLVTAPDELRINRVMERDQLSRAAVLERFKSQIPQEEKISKSNFIIINDEKHSLIEQTIAIRENLLLLKKS